MPQIIDTTNLFNLRVKKTQGIQALPISTFVDEEFAKFFMLKTLEGTGPVDIDKWLCIGAGGDCWMQSYDRLIAKYDQSTTLTDTFYYRFTPKPENEADAFFLSEDEVIKQGFDSRAPMYIRGAWGETIDGVPNLQLIDVGDACLRNQTDHSDQWRVMRKFFDNTYSVL
jgi:hypothetical protein